MLEEVSLAWTSPRLGGTLRLVDYRRHVVTSRSHHFVTERAGVPRRQVVNQLLHKFLFFLNSQRLEFGKQFYRGRIHTKSLSDGGPNVTRNLTGTEA
jgi:hypothetical protein